MAYVDDEAPQKRSGYYTKFFLLGAAFSVVLIGSFGIVALIDADWHWAAAASAVAGFCLIAAMVWVWRTGKAQNLNDEFSRLRFYWTRSYGLAGAGFIVLPSYFCLRYLEYLPAAWVRVITAAVPHPDDFAKGMMFVVWTILFCTLAARGVWQLRHK